MPPSPNTTASGEAELETVHESNLCVQQGIKYLISHDSAQVVTLKPYDDSLKEWETFSGMDKNCNNVTEKIKKFEERIQTLIQEDKSLEISKTHRKEKDSSTASTPSKTEDFVNEVPVPITAKTITTNGTSNGNGTIKLSTNSTRTKAVPKSSKLLGFTISLAAFLFLHLTALYGLHLVSNGHVINDKTIYLAFACHLISIGVHQLRKKITIKSDNLRFLMSLIQPIISKDSYFKWTRYRTLTAEKEKEMLSEINGNDISHWTTMGKPSFHKNSTSSFWISSSTAILLPILSVMMPWLFWNEALLTSYVVVGQLQNCISLYISSLIG